MKNKKIIMYVIVIILIFILIGAGYYIINKNKNKVISEYVPEEEISEKQLRQTLITLYFLNPNTLQLEAEIREIDSKILINYPYEVLIELLIEGPQNNNLIRIIPEKTKLLGTEIKNGVLYINFSKEFIMEENMGKDKEELLLKSIVNTLTELSEINKVAILIEGEESKGFLDNEVVFDKIFVR